MNTFELISRSFPPDLAILVDDYLPRKSKRRCITECFTYDESCLDTPLIGLAAIQVAKDGYDDLVKVLFKRGANPKVVLLGAVRGGQDHILNLVQFPTIDNIALESALGIAKRFRHKNMVARLSLELSRRKILDKRPDESDKI